MITKQDNVLNMASVSDTEDGWATLDEIPASSDNESIKQGPEPSTTDLQSKVDALQEKTDLLQLQIKLKDDSIKAPTDRLDALEAVDRHTQKSCVNSTQAVNFPQTDVSTLLRVLKDIETQSKDCKSAMADSVNRIDVKAKCLEDGTFKRFEEQTDRVNALEIHLVDLIDETDERVDSAMDEMEELRAKVRRIEKDVKDRIDSEQTTLVEQSSIDAIKRDVKALQNQNKDYDAAIYFLANILQDVEDKTERLEGEISERFERQTDRMNLLENHLESRVEVNSESIDRAVTEIHSRLEHVRIDKKDLQSQIRLNKGFIRSLTKRADALEMNVERVEEENSENLAVHRLLQNLERDTMDRFQSEIDRVKALEDKVEHLKQRTKNRLDSGLVVSEDQSKVDAMQFHIETLQSQSKDYKSSIDVLTDSVKDMGSKAKRFERKADHINAIGSALQTLEKAIKALDAKVERLERQEKDIQFQTRGLMEGLRKSINDCLTQTYIDFSGLTQRVKILEGSRQKVDPVYTTTMLNQESRARNWGAQVYGMQDGTGYGVFVPSYVNGSVRR